MKICLVLQADGQTDRYDEANDRFVFFFLQFW
jgi:hypothetical protein